MTTPTPEAVEAAMRCIQMKPMTPEDRCLIDNTSMGDRWQAGRILAAEVERLRCELGHAQDQLERIRTLCMGHGVGLRDDVWDVVK